MGRLYTSDNIDITFCKTTGNTNRSLPTYNYGCVVAMTQKVSLTILVENITRISGFHPGGWGPGFNSRHGNLFQWSFGQLPTLMRWRSGLVVPFWKNSQVHLYHARQGWLLPRYYITFLSDRSGINLSWCYWRNDFDFFLLKHNRNWARGTGAVFPKCTGTHWLTM